MTSTLMNTYNRLPVTFARGEGIWLWDTEGKRYLDALCGIAVNTLGHAHPQLVKAITEQVGRLMHVSNLYGIAECRQLSDRLAAISGMDNVFFCNSGCEANEAAIKLARLYGHQRNVENPSIIVMDNAFHGRTLATLSATGNRKVQAGFEPLVGGFVRVPFNDIESVKRIAARNPGVVAVLVEPIQGEGGINISAMEYLRELRGICDQHQWLLMLDEVQCGIGRTGKWFAYQLAGILPDVVTLAKGLAGGVPIGACLARGNAASVFHPGNHGSTFGGNPLATAAAFATLDIVEKDKLRDNADAMGRLIQDGLREQLQGTAGFVEVRGHGLMLGVQLDRPCAELVTDALAAGLLINVTADNVVRLLPALVINAAESRQLVDMLATLIKAFLQRKPAVAPSKAH
jgi:acetylornithine/N-succinyldiaminopimelate aminotransferase